MTVLQCSGSVDFFYGSGSLVPDPDLMDQDPTRPIGKHDFFIHHITD
jgi:hypothetical protein